MAKTRSKRRRKHRGSQSGRVDRTGRTSRPRNRDQAKSSAKARQAAKRDLPPTWGGAFRRALLAAGVFFLAVVLAFGQPIPQSISVAVLMLALYVPMGYVFDNFFWRRRMRAKQRARES